MSPILLSQGAPLTTPIYPDSNETSSSILHIFPWALVTLGPIKPSCCYKIASGCPEWLRMPGVCHGKNTMAETPIPQRSWSHLRVDFVTDLPSSEGFTCILVAVDRFFRPLDWFPSRVSQLLWEPQKYCLIMSAATLASQRILSQTEVHNSSPVSGDHSSPS